MANQFTYLIPHASSEELFEICKDSIKHTPAPIFSVGKEVPHWSEAFKKLWNECPTDIGVFMDDDCVLLKDISPLIEEVASGKWDAVGVEGLPPNPRNHPNYFDSNFLIINIGKFKREFGTDGINTNYEQAKEEITQGLSIEPFYGISQKLRGRIRPLKVSTTKYGMAVNLEDYAIHLWYGAWKHRAAQKEVNPEEMETRERQFIKDYNEGTFSLR